MYGLIIKLLPILFVLYPVLNIYSFPVGPLIPIGDVAFLIVGSLLLCFRKGEKLMLPKGLIVFWIYIGFSYFITNIDYFKVTNFIPGGISFCSMIFTLVICLRYLDLESFKKYYKIAVVCFSILFLIQEAAYMSIGVRPLYIIPTLPLANGQDMESLIMGQTTLARSSSCFREPAHFAVYILSALFFELYDSKKGLSINKRFLSPLAIFYIFILIIMRSGNGFLGLSFILLIKFVQYYKYNSMQKKIVTLLFLFPLVTFAFGKYIQSEQGVEMMNRAQSVGFNKNSESYDRTFRAYRLFVELPPINMIIGMSQNRLGTFIKHSAVKNEFTTNGDNDTYMNGMQNVLIHYGIIGLLLYLSLFQAMFRISDKYSRIYICLYLLLMMVSDLFISFSFILCIYIVQYRQKLKLLNKGYQIVK